MSVKMAYFLEFLIIRPEAIPATGALIGTPPSISARLEPQTEPIEVEPFEAKASETIRIVYGNLSFGGMTGARAFSARAPWPIILRLVPPILPVSPVEKGGKL